MYIYVCLYMFVHRDMFKTRSKFNPRNKDGTTELYLSSLKKKHNRRKTILHEVNRKLYMTLIMIKIL